MHYEIVFIIMNRIHKNSNFDNESYSYPYEYDSLLKLEFVLWRKLACMLTFANVQVRAFLVHIEGKFLGFWSFFLGHGQFLLQGIYGLGAGGKRREWCLIRRKVSVAVCCSVLQCVAVCCSVLQCVAVCCSVYRREWCLIRRKVSFGMGLRAGHVGAETQYRVVLQCVAMCCSVL